MNQVERLMEEAKRGSHRAIRSLWGREDISIETREELSQYASEHDYPHKEMMEYVVKEIKENNRSLKDIIDNDIYPDNRFLEDIFTKHPDDPDYIGYEGYVKMGLLERIEKDDEIIYKQIRIKNKFPGFENTYTTYKNK